MTNMTEHYQIDEYRSRLEELKVSIMRSQPSKRVDLNRLASHCDRLVDAMSSELVECRRKHKFTPKFNDLKSKFEDSANHLDQMIMFATLLE